MDVRVSAGARAAFPALPAAVERLARENAPLTARMTGDGAYRRVAARAGPLSICLAVAGERPAGCFATAIYDADAMHITITQKEAPLFLKNEAFLAGRDLPRLLAAQAALFADEGAFYCQYAREIATADPANPLHRNVLLASRAAPKRERVPVETRAQAEALLELACLRLLTRGRC